MGMESFKMMVRSICRCQNIYLLPNYSRPFLGQTGEGHFTPISGYCESSQKGSLLTEVLMLDIARYKYPPHWVDIEKLYKATDTMEPMGIPRGFLVVMNQIEVDQLFFQRLKDSNESVIRIKNNSLDVQAFKEHLESVSPFDARRDFECIKDFPDFFINLVIIYLIVKDHLMNIDLDVHNYYTSEIFL